jgi:hypothetical protein
MAEDFTPTTVDVADPCIAERPKSPPIQQFDRVAAIVTNDTLVVSAADIAQRDWLGPPWRQP